jgi:nucleolin
MKRDHQYMGDRFLDVKSASGKKTADPKKEQKPNNSRVVFVKGLDYKLTENDVGDIFKDCGKISNVRLVYNSKLGHFKG